MILCLCVAQPNLGKQPHQVELIKLTYLEQRKKTLLSDQSKCFLHI